MSKINSNPPNKKTIKGLLTERCQDEPLKEEINDRLGYKALIPSFLEYVNSFKSRQIIGIYGEWGSGKTTFTNMYLNLLGKENIDYYLIEFDAWRFKDDKNLWKSFFLNILKNLKNKKNSLNDPILEEKRYTDFFNRLCYSEDKIDFDFNNKQRIIGVIIFSMFFAFITNHFFQMPLVTILTLFTPILALFISLVQIRRSRGPINSFFEFEKDLDKLKIELKNVTDKDFPIVVIIENLDRVEPKYAIELLESIKTLFEFEDFMYFILCDPTILEKQIQEMYKTETLTAETYLQKIITIPFFLPPVETGNFENYIKSLLKENDFNGILIEYLNASGIKNPRKIKKILIEMDMTYRFMQTLNLDIKVPFILKLIILKYDYPYIFQLLKKYVENKNTSLEKASKYILVGINDHPNRDDVIRKILEEIFLFSPRDTAMTDRDKYSDYIKEAIVKITKGLDFIDSTRQDKYNISNLSDLNPYLLSVAVTGKTYGEKVEAGLGLAG